MKLYHLVLLFLAVFLADHFGNGAIYWTGWLNRDNPLNFGDFETYRGFSHPPCAPTYRPIKADCRVNDTKRVWYSSGMVLLPNHRCSSNGLACRHQDQVDYEPGDIICPDFEIRFLCHRAELPRAPETPAPPPTTMPVSEALIPTPGPNSTLSRDIV